ncbi:uncharacterized protein [Dermacentor albipictus]|uniref:uncharacterized protein isoform X2 n=1 Tax=Dermacentor albipictus TaxID=60249 RepID=UPI0038FCF5E7
MYSWVFCFNMRVVASFQMYAIVEFTATEEVEVVPCTWVNGDKCLWPKVPSDRATRMVRRAAKPDAGFLSYDALVKGVFHTYEDGRAKLEEARFRSDLSESDGGGKRKRIRPLRYSSESDSDDDLPRAPLQLSMQHKTPCRVPKKRRMEPLQGNSEMTSLPGSSRETPALPFENRNEDEVGLIRDCVAVAEVAQQSQAIIAGAESQQHLDASPSANCCRQTSGTALSSAEFQRRVINSLNIVRHNQAEIIQMLTVALQRNSPPGAETSNTPEPVLRCPLDSVREVLDFNEELTEGKSEALVLDLMGYGTRTLNTTIKSMMAYIMSDQAASEFSMDGRKGKVRFRDLKLVKVLFSAARRTRHHKDCTVDDVLYHIKEWLRRAKESCCTETRRYFRAGP